MPAKLYRTITNTLIARGLTITTMESCTSGFLASLITDTEGASAVMKGAFVTYSNEAKCRCGVPAETIERFGVYSPQTAAAMAQAAAAFYGADIAIGVTGSFANVDPNNADSVPGQVHYAIAFHGKTTGCFLTLPCSTRHAAKEAVAHAVGETLMNLLEENP